MRYEISQDVDPMNPREEDSNTGTMVCWHRKYALGDRHRYAGPQEFLESLAGKDLPADELLDEVEKNYCILPLYLLDHSGLSISTSSFGDFFDSGQVGWICASKDTMDEVPLRRTLKEEVEVYNQYLSGEVYGYQIIDDEGEVIDSLWGIYGYKEAEDLAKEAFEYHKKTRLDTKPNLLIEVRGGVIQAIKSNNPDKIRELLEGVRVIDYDEEGSLPCLYPVDKHENDTNP